MNPDSFFREVLESHQFRSSDKFISIEIVLQHIFICPIM
jgi:hypothetical protein